VILLVVILINSYPLYAQLKKPHLFSFQHEQNHFHTRLGRCLKQVSAPGDSIATTLIGRVPYYSGLYTIDAFGLIDPNLAHLKFKGLGSGAAGHEKSDRAYIMARKPTYFLGREIIIGPPSGPDWLMKLRSLLGIELPSERPSGLAPPYSGYSRQRYHCDGYKIRVWQKIDKTST
jgi:hypothetical protein